MQPLRRAPPLPAPAGDPLRGGSSAATIERNIAQLIAEGYDPAQAAAIAHRLAAGDRR